MRRFDLAGMFAHAIVRRVAFVLVAAVFGWLAGIGRADANTYQFPDKGAAWAQCASQKAEAWAVNHTCHDDNPTFANQVVLCDRRTGSCNWASGYHQYQYPTVNGGCPLPKQWDAATHTCFDGTECLAKPNLGPGVTKSTLETVCSAGCAFKAVGTSLTTLGEGGQSPMTYAPDWKASGAPCSVGESTPAPTSEQQCKPVGTLTMCMNPKGQMCATASNTGKQFCWQPGETGEKTDGADMQKRNAGNTPVPPANLQLSSGDSLVQTGEPATTTTTTKSGTTVTGTTTTTTTNYTTVNGTNAGTKDSGEPSDGSGGGEGEGDGEGTATGGTNCETPPITTGDPVLGMVATQTWATKCATEAGNAAKVTGDIGKCAEPFTVEGTNANAVKLRAMRAQLCNGDANGDGQPDWTKGDGTEAGDADTANDKVPGHKTLGIGADLLDTTSMIAPSSCPILPTLDFGPLGSFSPNSEPYFCDLVALMRAVVLLMGAFISISILMGRM